MDPTEAEINQKLDEELELREKLRREFGEFNFKFTLDEQVYFISENAKSLEHLIDKIKRAKSPKALIDTYRNLKLSLNNFIASISTGRDSLFAASKLLDSRGSQLDNRILQWKRSDYTKIIIAARNRLQHGGDLAKEIGMEVRSEHHPRGQGTILKLIPETVWQDIKSDLSTDAKLALDEAIKMDEDTFTVILGKFKVELVDLKSSLEEIFDLEFEKELSERSRTVSDLKKVISWFQSKGMHSISDLTIY